jgi:hypothetical protein
MDITLDQQKNTDLAIDLLSDLVCRFLQKETEKKQILRLIHSMIRSEDEEYLHFELTAELLGTRAFVVVA